VKCLGVKSNRSGIGARVRVLTGNHSQIAEVMSGSSYISQNDFRLHFGLGRASDVDRVEVRWPSGITDSVSRVQADQLIFIQEGQGMVRATKFRKP